MKKLKKPFIIVIVLMIIFIIIGSFSGDNSSDQQTADSAIKDAPASQDVPVVAGNDETVPAERSVVPDSAEAISVIPSTASETSETVSAVASVVSENTDADVSPDFSAAAVDIFDTLQNNEAVPYTLNEKARTFLAEHDDLFPASDSVSRQSIDDLTDFSIEARHILKNEDKYGDKLIALPMVQVAQISETEIENGHYFTEINVADENSQQYYVFYNGELSDVFEGAVLDITGLPLGNSSFDNIDGGQTLVIVLAACKVDMIE